MKRISLRPVSPAGSAGHTNVLRLLHLADAPQCASGDNYRPKFGVPRGGAVNITCRDDQAFAFTTDGVVGQVLTWKSSTFSILVDYLRIMERKTLNSACSLMANPPVTEFRWRFNSAGKASELRNYEVHNTGMSSTITYV